MSLDKYESVNTLIFWLKKLDNIPSNKGIKIDETYHVSSLLIPRWKNYISTRADFFDRYPEMTSHGTDHIVNMCNLCTELIVPTLREDIKKGTPEKNLIVNNAEFFLLIAGIFLHDIGMSDVSQREYSQGYIRRMHSMLSANIIDDCFRARLIFDKHDPRNIIPNIQNWEKQDVEALKKLCIHHQSSAPITQKDYENRKKFGVHISVEKPLCDYVRENKIDKRVIQTGTNTEYIYLIEAFGKSVDLVYIAALLRIIDAADIQYSRLGSALYVRSSVERILKRQEALRNDVKELKTLIKADSSEDVFKKELYHKYSRELVYLTKQISDHYARSASIEKVWFSKKKNETMNTFDVIYSVPDSIAQSLMLSTIENYSDYLTEKEAELSKELSKELEESTENEMNNGIFKSGLFNIFQKRDSSKCFKINLPSQRFDYSIHRNTINELMQFGEKWNKIPKLPGKIINYDKYDRKISEKILTSIKFEKSEKLFVFIGPKGSGKTTFSKALARKISLTPYTLNKVKRGKKIKTYAEVCYINCDGMNKNEEMENINFIITKFIYFLASQGDFAFYNLLRNDLSIDESYWEYLFRKLNKSSNIIIFDDFHKLSRFKESSVTYHFLELFFSILTGDVNFDGKATIIIFTQKLPIMMDFIDSKMEHEQNVWIPEIVELPTILESDIAYSFKKKLFNKSLLDKPELVKYITSLLIENRTLPIVVKFINDESDFFDRYPLEDGEGFNKTIQKKIEAHFNNEIINKLGAQLDVKILEYIKNYPIGKDMKNIIFLGDKEKEESLEQLVNLRRRGLLKYDYKKRRFKLGPLLYDWTYKLSKKTEEPEWWKINDIHSWHDFLLYNDYGKLQKKIFEMFDSQIIGSAKIDKKYKEKISGTQISLKTFHVLRGYFSLSEQGNKFPYLPISLPTFPDLILVVALFLDIRENFKECVDVRDAERKLLNTMNFSDGAAEYILFLVEQISEVSINLEKLSIEDAVAKKTSKEDIHYFRKSNLLFDFLWLIYAAVIAKQTVDQSFVTMSSNNHLKKIYMYALKNK